MKALIAFDKFKGSLSAAEACEVAAQAWHSVYPDAEITEAPLTDGGEGFVALLTEAAGGEVRRHCVTGPRGHPVDASFGLVSIANLSPAIREILELPDAGTLAVVEMAQASGLQLVPASAHDPWKTTTLGVGELLRHAAAARPAAILLGVGGSATHDLGLGALRALGLEARFASPSGLPPDATTPLVPAAWNQLIGFAGSTEKDLPPIWVASDVDNPLLGERGAATVFAPKKGLRPADLARLEEETARVARLLCSHFHRDVSRLSRAGAGAAGGIGAGLGIACGARNVSGFSLVRAWLDLDRKLARADWILTGEGTFDESSLEGKGPGVLVRNAASAQKRCLVLAGSIQLSPETRKDFPSCEFAAISPPDWSVEQAMAKGKDLLREAVLKNLETS